MIDDLLLPPPSAADVPPEVWVEVDQAEVNRRSPKGGHFCFPPPELIPDGPNYSETDGGVPVADDDENTKNPPGN